VTTGQNFSSKSQLTRDTMAPYGLESHDDNVVNRANPTPNPVVTPSSSMHFKLSDFPNLNILVFTFDVGKLISGVCNGQKSV
jgi:hypothetical protein